MQPLKVIHNKETKIKCQAEYTHFDGDLMTDTLDAFTTWLRYESRELIKELPHFGAVIEFWELITVKYDYGSSAEMIRNILKGIDSPDAYNEFVNRYKLSRKGWFKTLMVK